MHRFPKEQERFIKWLKAINRMDIEHKKKENHRVCEHHFSNKMKFIAYHNRTNLKATAIPDLHIIFHVEEDVPGLGNIDASTTEDTAVPSTSSCNIERDQYKEIERESKKRKRVLSSRAGLSRKVNFAKLVNLQKALLTPKKKKLINVAKGLLKTARQLNRENKSNKERLKEAYKYSASKEFISSRLNNQAMNFFLGQLNLQKKKPKGRRFSTDDKILALSFLKQSPKGYKLLKKVFALPSRKTLLNVLKPVTFKSGINRNILITLRQSVEKMKPLDRYCTVIFDEMSEASLAYKRKDDLIEGFDNSGLEIKKKFASHAMVFMARGVRRKWKQPIAYYFAESGMPSVDIMRNLKNIIVELLNIGLNVIATVCDQSTMNCSAIKMLLEETKRNYIKMNNDYRICGFEIQNREIVPLFDPPHLLKGLRNNIIDSEVEFSWKKERQLASWKYIIQLYEMDAKDEVTVCYKLTDEHIYPAKMRKMKVKHAAQVLSHTVNAGIRSNVTWGEGRFLPVEALDTADFVLFADTLFDSVNGRNL